MPEAGDAADAPDPADATDDVDPEQLREQLTEIKGAIGLAEQYPGRARLWLFVGLLIAVAALFAQATFFFNERLSGAAYALIWTAFVVVAVAASWWMASRLPQTAGPDNAPSWRALFGGLAAFLAALTGVAADAAQHLGGLDQAILYFGFAIATIGLGLVITGAVLSAYHVRRRDRLVFYAGGVWVLIYASWLPHVQILRWVGVGLFGVLFGLYAVVAYAYLTRA